MATTIPTPPAPTLPRLGYIKAEKFGGFKWVAVAVRKKLNDDYVIQMLESTWLPGRLRQSKTGDQISVSCSKIRFTLD